MITARSLSSFLNRAGIAILCKVYLVTSANHPPRAFGSPGATVSCCLRQNGRSSRPNHYPCEPRRLSPTRLYPKS